jgi:CubicO group peptidase (beta-lactamase class C family)
MKPNTLGAVLALSALALAGCDRGHMVNSGVCADFTAANHGQTAAGALASTDAAAPAVDCLQRWAYSLAGARDEADVVADAVVAACAAPMARWGQSALSQSQGEGGVSLTTGQSTNPLAEHSAFARGRAVLYVVAARAGRCAPPPMANGTPAGLN